VLVVLDQLQQYAYASSQLCHFAERYVDKLAYERYHFETEVA
jgi:hypothetical protein